MQNFSLLMSIYAKERPDWFRLALDSIFDQTVRPAEVVLVEDGQLPEILESVVVEYEQMYSEMKVFRYSENRGLGRALNDGLQHCTYDLVARMDTDDICLPHRFERQLKVFEEHPEVDLCSTWIDEFDEDPARSFATRVLPEGSDALFEFGKRRNPVNHMTVMFRRKKVLESGGYLHCPLFEDYYLWCRMLNDGCKFYNIQESLVWARCPEAMYQRRGGFSYAVTETKFLWKLYKVGYINVLELMTNCSIRIPLRVMPTFVRRLLYKLVLRYHGRICRIK